MGGGGRDAWNSTGGGKRESGKQDFQGGGNRKHLGNVFHHNVIFYDRNIKMYLLFIYLLHQARGVNWD